MSATQGYTTRSGNGSERETSLRERAEELLPAGFAEGEARVREFIRAHPVPVVLGAVFAGFVLARMMRED